MTDGLQQREEHGAGDQKHESGMGQGMRQEPVIPGRKVGAKLGLQIDMAVLAARHGARLQHEVRYRVPDDDLPERSGSFTRISGTVVRQIMSKGALVDTPCVRVRCDCGDESFFRRNQWMRPYNRSGCVACKRKKRQAEKDREAGGVLAVYAVRYVGKRSKKGVAA